MSYRLNVGLPQPCRLRRSWDQLVPDESLVDEPLSDDVADHLAETLPVVSLPGVEPERLLVEVAEEMEGLDAHVGSLDRALEQAPEVLKAVGVDVADRVALGMVDDGVDVIGLKAVIGANLVGEELGAGLHVRLDLWVQGAPLVVVNDLGADGAMPVRPVTLKQPHDGGLAARPTALDDALTAPGVHEAGASTNESLVSLNLAGHLGERPGLHGEPNPMEHEPRGFLSDVEVPTQLVGADSVLTVGDEPKGGEPLVQTDRAVFHDRPDFDGELLSGVILFAGPHAPGGDEGDLFATASRARNISVGPAHADHESEGTVRIGEELDSFEGGFGSVMAVHGYNIGSLCV